MSHQVLAEEVTQPSAVHRAHGALRNATHDLHVRVNRHPLVVGITRTGYPPGSYYRVLLAYRTYYEWLERAIDSVVVAARLSSFWEPRRKSLWLEDDIQSLGIEASSTGPELKIADNWIPHTRAALIGVFYATEGSSLGGRIIGGHLRRNLGLTPERGARFFHGYGDAIDQMWGEYLQLAGELNDDPAGLKLATDAAIKVFEGIGNALDR